MSKSTARSTKVNDPNAKGSNGFLIGVGVLVLIIVAVIGYIVWSGQGAKTAHLGEHEAKDVNLEMSFADNAITLQSPDVKSDAKEVDYYEDFSCVHCADLAKQSDDQVLAALESGDLILHVRPLNFLDKGGQLDAVNLEGHSTKSVASVVAVAESGDVNAFWNLREVLMLEQQSIVNKWSQEDFADAVKQLGGSDEAVNAVADADPQSGEDVASANATKLDEETGSVSSPRLRSGGEELEYADESGQPKDWVAELINS